MCLGFEPRAAGSKAQTNPLSYGGTPLHTSFASISQCAVHFHLLSRRIEYLKRYDYRIERISKIESQKQTLNFLVDVSKIRWTGFWKVLHVDAIRMLGWKEQMPWEASTLLLLFTTYLIRRLTIHHTISTELLHKKYWN